MNAKEKMIVALDFSTMEEAILFIEKMNRHVVYYKVGLELFLNSEGRIIEFLKSRNKKIFLDLKFHDIPNTTAMASAFAARKNVDMFNVHISGGESMMKKVVEETKRIDRNALIIGVTILTSFTEEEISHLFNSKNSLKELAVNLAKLAEKSGLDGVVCSPWEAKDIKKICGEKFLTVCPGVRPSWAPANDQIRIMTPKDAILNGCDYLVIGRPITKNEDPVGAALLIEREISDALEKL